FNQRVSLGRNDLLIRTFPKLRSFISNLYIYLYKSSSSVLDNLI
ncbi:propanediol utilization protein, partial [Klebsiella pneumoniae]